MSKKSSDPKPEGDRAPAQPSDHAAERLREFERARGLDPDQSSENAKGSANPPLPNDIDEPLPPSKKEGPGPSGGKPPGLNR